MGTDVPFRDPVLCCMSSVILSVTARTTDDTEMIKTILVEKHAHFCDCCDRVFDCGDVECGTILDTPCRDCIEVSILRLERVQRRPSRHTQDIGVERVQGEKN